MNERIKELILEAGFPKFDKMYVVSDGEELVKFAELIVRECCQKLENDGMVEVAMEMKEHFGVNEEIENLKAGAEIHAGDKGYSIGTQEGYDEFMKKRNEGNPELAEQMRKRSTYYGNDV
jgi:DNA-binding FadR family transcriptional regulator